MPNEILIERPNLTDYQKAIIYSDARFTITEAATKCGKTFSHLWWLFESANLETKRGANYWWVAPVYQQAEIAFNRLRRVISQFNVYNINLSKLTVECPNGAIIHFKSAEKPDNLYGEDVYGCVFDEFTRAREDAWFALRSTLTKTQGKCKLIGNAKGKKNWGYILGAKARGGEPNYQYHRITAYDAIDAGILEREEVEQAKRDLPEVVFKELYLAEPQEDGSNPFGFTFIKQCVKTISLKPAKYFGFDLAKKQDWTVIIGLDADGNVAYFDRFQIDWQTTTNRIKTAIGYNRAYGDSTGVGDPIIETIQQSNPRVEGINYTSRSKQQLMEGLAMAIQSGKTSILYGIHQDEIESFEFEHTRTGIRYNAPIGMTDDCVNAHALAWKCYDENKVEITKFAKPSTAKAMFDI